MMWRTRAGDTARSAIGSTVAKTLRPRTLGIAAAATMSVLLAGCGNGLVSSGQPTGIEPSSASPSAPASSASPSASTSSSASKETSSSSTSEASGSAGSTSSATSGSGTGGSGSGTTRASNTCTLGDLSIGVRASDGGAAAGSNYVLLTFKNISSSTCYLRGYAGVSFVGKQNGTQLGHAADRVRGRELSTVQLSVGETEKELLQIANAGNYDASDCAPTTSDGFRVYPPAETKAAYVPFKTQACQTSTVHQLSVYPVGTSG